MYLINYDICLLIINTNYYKILAEIVLPEPSEEPHQQVLNCPKLVVGF